MAPKLPEGYSAPGYYASRTTALDSAALARKGEVHDGYGQRWSNSRMDPFVEFNINGDPRLERLKASARELGKRYADPGSPDYLADARQREKAITDRIMPLIYDAYGSYSHDTVKQRLNAGEWKARGVLLDGTAYLKDMEKGSLVCRHYAAVASVLLHEAEVPNHLVASSGIAEVSRKDGKYQIDPGQDFSPGHMYVVTDQGKAIVEATGAAAYANGNIGHAYKPIINGVTVQDIVHYGHAALTDDRLLYGGHLGDGNLDPDRTRRGKEYTLARYNEELQSQPKPPEPPVMIAQASPARPPSRPPADGELATGPDGTLDAVGQPSASAPADEAPGRQPMTDDPPHATRQGRPPPRPAEEPAIHAPAPLAPQNPLVILVQAFLTLLGLGDLFAVRQPDPPAQPPPSEARATEAPPSRDPAALQAALDRGYSAGQGTTEPLAVNSGLPMARPARTARQA